MMQDLSIGAIFSDIFLGKAARKCVFISRTYVLYLKKRLMLRVDQEIIIRCKK